MMTYDDVIPELYSRLEALGARRPAEMLALRNIRGTVGLVLRRASDQVLAAELEAIVASLGYWANPEGQRLFFAEDLSILGDVFSSPELAFFRPEGGAWELPILNRLVTGTEWYAAQYPVVRACRAPRVVFYGIKGGVGRSTALSVVAYRLARAGRNLLLVDLDLESPGLSGLLLPDGESVGRARLGAVDYLVESAVDPAWDRWGELVSTSPLERAPDALGKIKLISACGVEGHNYLEKLSRVYGPAFGPGGEAMSFSRRIERMIDGVAASLRPQPDAILVDSRAGLHDIAASSIVNLADLALLFAVDTPQTWEDYRLLFSHWLKSRGAAQGVRRKLQIVDALFPFGFTSAEARARDFLTRSFELFSMLYDEIDADEANDDNGQETFSFSLEDGEAPHSPWRTVFSPQLLEFEPISGMGRLGGNIVESFYSDFLDKFMIWLGAYGSE